MDNIDAIMNMLDWNNKIEIQNKGIKLGENIKTINVFIQPLHKKYNKNVWENCAIILNKHNDITLEPYLNQLFEWLQDLNWPGALIIFDRLKKFNIDKLKSSFEFSIQQALKQNDTNWLLNLSYLLDNDELKSKINKSLIKLLTNDLK